VLSGDIGFSRGEEAQILAAAGTPLPLSARAVFVPERSERIELTVFQDVGDMHAAPREGRGGRSESGTRSGRATLSVVELDVTAGSEVALHCALSASGSLSLSARHDGAVIEMPLLLPGGPESGLLTDRSEERLREAKLRAASLEALLSEAQKDRLRSVIRRLERAGDGPAAVETLEKLTRDLEIALS
jgi:hypothetical protein